MGQATKLLIGWVLLAGCNLFTPTEDARQPDGTAADSGGSASDTAPDLETPSPDVAADSSPDLPTIAPPDLASPDMVVADLQQPPEDMSSDWWDSAWTRRVRIEVGATGSGTQVDVPVMVSLTAARFDAAVARTDLDDLRFLAEDHTTLLTYEIEQAATPIIWVRVPEVRGTPVAIWLYYGNPTAARGEDPEAVWDAGFVAVWHFDDLTDSTANGNDFPNTGNTVAATHLGSAAKFGTQIYRRVPDTPSLHSPVSTLTISTWLRHDSSQGGWAAAIAREYGTGGLNDFWFGLYANQLQLDMRLGNDNVSLTGQAIPLGVWTHIAGVLDRTTRRLYVNGTFDVSDSFMGTIAQTPGPIHIGADSNDGDDSRTDWLDGALDELRVSNIARTTEWLSLQHRSMTDTLLVFGSVETRD